MASELKLSGTTARVILQGNDTITSDQTFTFPDSGGEMLVSNQSDAELNGLTVGTNAQPSVVINRAYGVFVKPVSTADGGTGGDALWQGYANDGSTITSKIRADGQLNLGTQDTNSNAAGAKGIQALGSTGQLVIQGSSGETIDTQNLFHVYYGDSAKFLVNNRGNVTVQGAIICANLQTSTAAAANIKFINNQLTVDSSSIRWKTDVETADSDICLNIVKNSRPVWYRSNQEVDDPGHSYWGFIAEEVDELEPRLCSYDIEGKPNGVGYDRYVPVLTSVLQQALTRIEQLESRLAQLEGQS